jgi:hypothetical protein
MTRWSSAFRRVGLSGGSLGPGAFTAYWITRPAGSGHARSNAIVRGANGNSGRGALVFLAERIVC